MADIRSYINSHILPPLKSHNTIYQDTIMEISTEKLEELYDLTVKFPEIVKPDASRIDILNVIADQYVFDIRDEAELQEQVDILEHIMYVYNIRGSVDSIENMWKYYGGDLPKEITLEIPTNNLFRYSISKLSDTHVFSNDPAVTGLPGEYHPGVYEVKLYNNTYSISKLRDFMLRELVAAGVKIYFTNTIHTEILGDSPETNPYDQVVYENLILEILQLGAFTHNIGLVWDGIYPLSDSDASIWSSETDLHENFLHYKEMLAEDATVYTISELEINDSSSLYAENKDMSVSDHRSIVEINNLSLCTINEDDMTIVRDSYDSSGNLLESRYPGYFVLAESMLGEVII